MKLTDFAIIFVAILLPIVIIVFVNTSFVVKAEKQEMYYKNLMNSAVKDALNQMKQVENEDKTIDYGYSGIIDNKVSINESIGFSTFFNSLASNFNIRNNEMSMERLKLYIPVVAILDYDGIYIHSAEKNENNEVSFITKPKVGYTYIYVIEEKQTTTLDRTYNIINLEEVENLNSISLFSNYIYEVNFTMDDYIYLNIYRIDENGNAIQFGSDTHTNNLGFYSRGFYLTDSNNNEDLVYSNDEVAMLSADRKKLTNEIVEKLKEMRKKIIAKTAMREISYAVNKHNVYAKEAGITYNFTFSVESDSEWYETVDGIGMLAIIQGISLGNRYLNYKAYSASDLIMAKKYYVSDALYTYDQNGNKESHSYMSRKLYHISDKCPVYKEYINNAVNNLIPKFYTKKADAATQGFYPCPVCNP